MFIIIRTILGEIDQIKNLIGQVDKSTDKGYRGLLNYEGCEIVHADNLRKKSLNKDEKIKIKEMLRRRCGIEEII